MVLKTALGLSATHLSVAEVNAKVHAADDDRQREKWLVIHNALMIPIVFYSSLLLVYNLPYRHNRLLDDVLLL